jgi:hypothetical protein
MNMKSAKNGEEIEEQALFSGQFKRKSRNCGQIGHKLFLSKNRANTMVVFTIAQLQEIIALTAVRRVTLNKAV